MKAEERFNIFFDTAPIPNFRYGFGYNDVIQTRRVRDIIHYPNYGVPLLDMQPATVFENNNTYGVIQYNNLTSCLISIASRSGGYHFIDYPAAAFIKNFMIHKDIFLNIDADFSNSYLRFTAPVGQPTPFVIPLVFLLYPE